MRESLTGEPPRAVVFFGADGVGKTTHARLLEEATGPGATGLGVAGSEPGTASPT